jgi:hypothetical protein
LRKEADKAMSKIIFFDKDENNHTLFKNLSNVSVTELTVTIADITILIFLRLC